MALLLYSIRAFSQEGETQAPPAFPPWIVGLNVLGSPFANGKNDETEVIGADIVVGSFFGQLPVAAYFDLGAQKQDIGPDTLTRYSFSLGLNYYLEVSSWRGAFKPFIGVKAISYFGKGKTGDALDCLECTDEREDYDGGETFATVGVVLGTILSIKVDYRLTDYRSDFTNSGYDPYGVGDNFNRFIDGIPDPKLLLSVGIVLMRP